MIKILFLMMLSVSTLAQSLPEVTYGEFIDFSLEDATRYQPREIPFTSVTEEYGALYVRPGKYEYTSDHEVWSSHWYPYHETILWEGKESTLYKYDAYAARRGVKTDATNYERKNVYNPRASDWEGLCNAWAMAAITFKEPKKGIKLYGVPFEVKDLKALLLKSLELELGDKFYGQRNNAEWDSIYADVYPDQFHRFLQVEGFEKKNPFIMDFDAGYQVWNVPVYKVKSFIKEDESNDEVLKVKTYVYYASPFNPDPNFVGLETETKVYSYDLHGKWEGDQFRVNYGLWTGSSRWDHPDYLIPKPNRELRRESRNKEINPKIVDEILRYSF